MTYSRVGINGWRVGSDSSAVSRVGIGGWYVVKATGGGGSPTGAARTTRIGGLSARSIYGTTR